MDFLDPRARRAHRRRLKAGYILMAVLIALGTTIIINLADGWFVDRKTGELIRNGTVFVDSKPRGGRVYLDDVEQRNRTDMRMDIPAGVHKIRIEVEGFRHWERTFNLEGGEIERLVYPFLIPNQFLTTDVAQYEVMPGLAMHSPDRRWLIVQRPGQTYQFDVFDLNDPAKAPAQIVLPPGILTTPGAEALLTMVEWSTDNRHVLLKRDFDDTSEYIVLDRENPSESININTLMGIKPAVITLRDKRPDQFYYLDAVPGLLRVADTKNRTISAPLLTSVKAYKTYSDDIIMYVTEDVVEAGKAEFRVLENDKTYTLKQTGISDRYVMDVSRYDNKWYYVAGASNENIVYVYEDPLPVLKSQNSGTMHVMLMRLDNPRFVAFSANTQFIGLTSGSHILTLDLEANQQYRTDLQHDIPIDYEFDWMDGHRFVFTVNQQSYIVDFDGSNENTLVTSRLSPGPFFDRNYDSVFTFEESKADGSKKALTQTVIED